MRQVWISAAGGAERLQVREAADPKPKSGEVRVRVVATGINFADILARMGLYPDSPPIPCVVGYEVSGTVDEVGDGVSGDWVGRAVFGMTRFGGYADTVCVPADQMFEKPASLSHEQAAAIPVNYLTAWQLLVAVGALTDDETVLIHNAGGGVGLAAIDIAKHIGARIIGTASAGKHAFLKERGVHETIDYRSGDWLPAVKELTGGRGADLITDPIGGASWKKSYAALRHTGRLGMFGASTLTESSLPGPLKLAKLALSMPIYSPIGLMDGNRGVFGVNMGHLWHEVAKIRRWMTSLLQGVENGWVRPHVDRVFTFDEAGAAHTYIEERRNVGKVLLKP